MGAPLLGKGPRIAIIKVARAGWKAMSRNEEKMAED
jgi:hypothetical protein